MASVGLMPSPTNGLSSSFSPFTDSPASPAPYKGASQSLSNRSSGPSDSLAPPVSPYPQTTDPSPVDSNGTESTEIEDQVQDDGQVTLPSSAVEGDEVLSPDIEIASPQSLNSERMPHINTMVDRADDAPQSAIHAPPTFKAFDKSQPPVKEGSEDTVVSPATPEAAPRIEEKRGTVVSPVNTDVPRFPDRTTPRAHTRQETDDDWKRRSRRASSLEDIPEAADKDVEDKEDPDTAGLVGDGKLSNEMQVALHNAEEEVAALRTALTECWTLCNTLATLSSSHRQRTFKFAGKQDMQESAWRSCWKLCQQLYDSRDEDHASQVIPTLELCREFCQCLFEARSKTDEASDSVLRVSFELNNHLYNTNHGSLPEAFNERTLDFYITLCHRLMKQRTSLPQETDALLRACWSLAEMLFNLRQNNREGKNSDEELLGSAVQACWELCDLFREGWTQIRPDRGTPRPSQVTFQDSFSRQSAASKSVGSQPPTRSNSSLSSRKYHDAPAAPIVPETPTTIFDDTTSSATSSPDDPNIPNILVLGPVSSSGASNTSNSRGRSHHDRWSSNASVLSGYSESAASASSSQRSSSTATAGTEDLHLARLRYLLVAAAHQIGYPRPSSQPLPSFVKGLRKDAFGSLPWQVQVLGFYKRLVLGDQSMMGVHNLPTRRLGLQEAAKSVRWLGRGEQWAWMRDLFRVVFGVGIDEVGGRGGGISV